MAKVKRKRKKWKLRVLFLSLLCGALYFANQRYDCFRLQNLEITPGGILSDSVIWEAVPAAAHGFWPSMIWESRNFARRIENFYPVAVELKPTGWGRYRVIVKPLDVMIYVSWNSRMWLLSSNGRMWLANLPANTRISGLVLPEKPILSWDSGLPIPIDPERQGGDIYPSSLPLVKINRWYDTIAKTNWYPDTYCLLAKKVDGKPVVQILLGRENAITGEIIVKDDTANWLAVAEAVAKIFPQGEYKASPGMIINATFSELKFTVSKK